MWLKSSFTIPAVAAMSFCVIGGTVPAAADFDGRVSATTRNGGADSGPNAGAISPDTKASQADIDGRRVSATTQSGGADYGPSGGTALSGAGCGPVDQTQLSSNTCMAFFSQTDLAQSFTTDATLLCGARIDLVPGTGGADVTIALWDGLPNAGGNLLGSGTDFSVPDGGVAIVSFGGDIPVNPGDQYFLVLTAANGNPCILGDTNNPYPGGQVYANPGYNPFPTFDYTFETYGTADLPCGPIDQTQLSSNVCMALFSQTDLAQSFTTDATLLCGARIDLVPGTGGADVTIALWDGLPNAGGNLLGSGTDFSVPDGGVAIVSFGGDIPVNPGDQYFLVFTATNGNTCILGDTNNPYPGGQVYANPGYNPFPNFDYTFETYGTACPADLDGPDGVPDGVVGVHDLLFLIGVWGDCPPKGDCPADLDGPNGVPDGVVGVHDLLFLIGVWGDC